MLEKFPKDIGASTYEVTQLDATTAWKLGLKLTKALARGGLAASDSGADVNTIGLAIAGVARIITEMPEEDAAFIINTFKAATVVVLGPDSKPPLAKVFDLQFAGKMDQMLEWLQFSVEVNYGPLVEGLKAKAAELFAKKKSAAQPGLAKAAEASSSPSQPA